MVTDEVICPRKDWHDDDWLNQSQKDHLDGTFDVYKPIEAYKQEWVHEIGDDGTFVCAYPIEDTKTRMDLPPIVNQWKHNYNRRHNNV